MMKLAHVLSVSCLVTVLPNPLAAQVNPVPFNCPSEVADLKTVIANERFDEYTNKQVQALIQDVEKALANKAEAACLDDVQKLKHILHLDH